MALLASCRFFLIFCLVGITYTFSPKKDLKLNNENVNLDVCETVTSNGYPCETYQMSTIDKYVLSVHRIPYGKYNNTPSDRVVFLMHGILLSSASWIITGPENGFGYILADHGYDVWMGNARGNEYSRNHFILNPNVDNEFWDFSWHEIGSIDVPTMINFVLAKTRQKSLFHIGFSQGTTTFYVMTSLHPEYNQKIRAHFSLAPIAFSGHVASPLIHMMGNIATPMTFAQLFMGPMEFLRTSETLRQIGKLCTISSSTESVCSNILYYLFGKSPKEMNSTLLPIMTGYSSGASTKQLLHYAQLIQSGYFARYDYGTLMNFIEYMSPNAPNYQLNKITAPVYLIWSYNDLLAAEIDVKHLFDSLPPLNKYQFVVSDTTFNHLDYMFGIRAKELVYQKVLDLLSRH